MTKACISYQSSIMKHIITLFLLLSTTLLFSQNNRKSSFGISDQRSIIKGDDIGNITKNRPRSILLKYNKPIKSNSELQFRLGFTVKSFLSDFEDSTLLIGQDYSVQATDNISFLTLSLIYTYQPIKYAYMQVGINNQIMVGYGFNELQNLNGNERMRSYRPNKQYSLELYSSAGIQIPIWRFLLRGGVFTEIAINHSYWNYGLELGAFYKF